jgi:hypothetical protein
MMTLAILEKRFGPGVRQMGSWNSDGTFAYSSVPMVTVEKAAEAMEDQHLDSSFSRLRKMTDRTKSDPDADAHTAKSLPASIGRFHAQVPAPGSFGLRRTVGASRARIVRQLLAESLTLVVISGLVGLLIAQAGIRLILALKPGDLAIDVVHFAAGNADECHGVIFARSLRLRRRRC